MKRLVIYLAVTFGLTWGLHIPAGIALGTFENGEATSAVMIGIIAVSMFFPMIGALIANAACDPADRIDLCWKPLIRQNVRHYLAAWFIPTAIALLGCVVFFILNPGWFDPSMSSFTKITATTAGMSPEQFEAEVGAPTPLMVGATMLFAITIAPFVNMIPAFGEELGWRGMLFPTLAEHASERTAALVSGAIWGLWHAPVIAMGHNYGMDYPGFPFVGIAVMILACTAFGCWLAHLRLRSGSVWPCALAHGAFNAVANFGLLFSAHGSSFLGPTPLGLEAGIPLLVLGVVCWLRLSPSVAHR